MELEEALGAGSLLRSDDLTVLDLGNEPKELLKALFGGTNGLFPCATWMTCEAASTRELRTYQRVCPARGVSRKHGEMQ